MHRPHVPHVRPFLFVGSLLCFIGSTWGMGWAVATAVGSHYQRFFRRVWVSLTRVDMRRDHLPSDAPRWPRS